MKVLNVDFKRALEELGGRKFDIIFLDPPYKTDFGLEATKIIMEKEMLKDGGIIIFETDREEEYIKDLEEFAKIINVKKYGRVKLVLLTRKE